MIQKYKKGLSYTQWCFLMHIDSLSFPVIIWVNYYHNNKRTNNEMNVVNTRTNILYIHGCYTRTSHKKMTVVTHVNPILEIFIIITQSRNSDAKISWEDPCIVACGHATSSVGGYVGT